jgi:soluble lytic murein transglycosylase-like protein
MIEATPNSGVAFLRPPKRRKIMSRCGQVESSGNGWNAGWNPGEVDQTDPTQGGGQPPAVDQNLQAFMPSQTGNAELDRYDADIARASQSTGVDADYIKATMFAESRMDPTTQSVNPDGTDDYGLMQIGTQRYAGVQERMEGAPANLDLKNNPSDNIMAGAWELKEKLAANGGDYRATSAAYIDHGNAGDSAYADSVMQMMADLKAGRGLIEGSYGAY